jgi:hypothetical protein
MSEPGYQMPEALLVPAGVALGAEEDGALVVIEAVNRKTQTVKTN